MLTRQNLLLAATACGLLVGSVLWFTTRGDAAGNETQATYVCSETGAITTAPPQTVPALNPETGRRTLLRGVYCPQCARWYAAPSQDHVAGNPKELTCGIHHVPMTTEGPTE